jgi:ligand-binding sensor domain-containing protein
MNRTILISLSVLFVSITVISCQKDEDNPVTVKGLRIGSNSRKLNVGDSIALDAIISPSNATNKTLVWSSSDSAIAKVNSRGVVTGISAGIDTIKVTTADGNMAATCLVSVVKWITYDRTNSDLINDTILCVTTDRIGNVWIGTIHGISIFDGTNWNPCNGFNSDLRSKQINCITIDDQDIKWIGTSWGLLAFDDQNWTLFLTLNSGIINNTINSIVCDAQGNKWIGTDNGISKFDGTGWITFNSSNSGLINDMVGPAAIDSQGNIWFGTDSGISKFNGTNWNSYTPKDGLAGNHINTIGTDAHGNMWFGTWEGLSKFAGSNWTTYFDRTQINAFAIDADGYIWVSTYNYIEGISNGVLKFDGMNWTTYNTTNSGLVNNGVISIAIDNHNNKWFGTLGGISELQD